MDNRAPSLLPAVRVVEGQAFKPDVGSFGVLSINIRVDIIPAIETTCVDVTPARVSTSGLPVRLPCP